MFGIMHVKVGDHITYQLQNPLTCGQAYSTLEGTVTETDWDGVIVTAMEGGREVARRASYSEITSCIRFYPLHTDASAAAPSFSVYPGHAYTWASAS